MPSTCKEGVIPEGRRLFEHHLDRMRIDFVDMIDVCIRAGGGGTRRRISGKFPGKNDVIGGKRLAVMPYNVFLQAPGDP